MQELLDNLDIIARYRNGADKNHSGYTPGEHLLFLQIVSTLENASRAKSYGQTQLATQFYNCAEMLTREFIDGYIPEPLLTMATA